ncbi:MAG TPA: GNAT family N-acetyltransferase [Vicinamibacteria bacterium]
MGENFRDLTPGDLEAGRQLSLAAGWNQTRTDWEWLLAPPSVFRGALLGERVTGCAGAVLYGRELAWLCMVLVDPAFRGRGLGSELVRQVLARLRDVASVGLDATPQGRAVYERLGFTAGCGLVRTLAEPRPAAGGVTLAGPARLLSAGDLAQVLAWDHEVFGADRSHLLRHAFAAAPDYAWTFEKDGALEGYCLGRAGRRADQIGPVVARSTAAALQLVQAVRARHPSQPFFVDVPAAGEVLGALAEQGFTDERPFTRMYRGTAAPALHPELMAIVGPEFG